MARITAGRRLLTVILCAPLLMAVTARGEEGEVRSPSSLEAFEQLHERLTAAPEGAAPAPGVTEAAGQLRFDLQTELIRRDAEIQVLKLEVARFGGARQAAALDRLVEAATSRERRIWLALRQLEGLAGGSPVAMVVEEEAEPDGEPGEGKRGMEISFEPQDVIEDPDP